MSANQIKPIGPLTPDQIQRFWKYVDKRGPDECWDWKASVMNNGYGQFNVNDKMVLAHRIAFFLAHQRNPTLFICHACDRKICVNSRHLFEGTQKDNIHDAVVKGRMWRGRGSESRPRGEKCHLSKLTNEQVLTIRQFHGEGRAIRSLARQFKMSPHAVSDIVKRNTWTHI